MNGMDSTSHSETLSIIDSVLSNLKSLRQNPRNVQLLDVVENDLVKVKQTLSKISLDKNVLSSNEIDAKIAEINDNEMDSLLNDIENDTNSVNHSDDKQIVNIIEKPVEQSLSLCLSLHKESMAVFFVF